MTPTVPDPRLLLPASAVRRVPEGARVWHPKHGDGVVIDPDDPYAPAVFRHTTGVEWSSQFLGGGVQDLAIDLSAPLDGERLDALPWALRQLHPEARSASFPTRDARWLYLHADSPLGYIYQIVPSVWTMCGTNVCVIEWPDLSDLSPDDAARAVVVAALVALAVRGATGA